MKACGARGEERRKSSDARLQGGGAEINYPAIGSVPMRWEDSVERLREFRMTARG